MQIPFAKCSTATVSSFRSKIWRSLPATLSIFANSYCPSGANLCPEFAKRPQRTGHAKAYGEPSTAATHPAQSAYLLCSRRKGA
jgi:hypothetical protein